MVPPERSRDHGFDVMRDAMGWASRHITPLRPHFTFQHVDVYNGLYTTGGRLPCDQFLFPFDDGSFDFVFLTSVFTHMVGRDVRHYLDEIARVLAPAGRAVVTGFVLTEEARRLVSDRRTTMTLTIPYGDGFTADRTTPEGAIGFHEARLMEWIEERSLRVTTVLPGSWCGRASRLGYQDLLLIEPA